MVIIICHGDIIPLLFRLSKIIGLLSLKLWKKKQKNTFFKKQINYCRTVKKSEKKMIDYIFLKLLMIEIRQFG